jgi:hypothetical protein
MNILFEGNYPKINIKKNEFTINHLFLFFCTKNLLSIEKEILNTINFTNLINEFVFQNNLN